MPLVILSNGYHRKYISILWEAVGTDHFHVQSYHFFAGSPSSTVCIVFSPLVVCIKLTDAFPPPDLMFFSTLGKGYACIHTSAQFSMVWQQYLAWIFRLKLAGGTDDGFKCVLLIWWIRRKWMHWRASQELLILLTLHTCNRLNKQFNFSVWCLCSFNITWFIRTLW